MSLNFETFTVINHKSDQSQPSKHPTVNGCKLWSAQFLLPMIPCNELFITLSTLRINKVGFDIFAPKICVRFFLCISMCGWLNKFHCDIHLRHLLRVQKFFYALIAFWRIKKYCLLFTISSISSFTLCSASFRLLLLKFDIRELRPRLIHWSLKYQGVELRNLQDVSCRPRFEFGMTFPTLCLTPERWMDSRVQSTVGCFP